MRLIEESRLVMLWCLLLAQIGIYSVLFGALLTRLIMSGGTVSIRDILIMTLPILFGGIAEKTLRSARPVHEFIPIDGDIVEAEIEAASWTIEVIRQGHGRVFLKCFPIDADKKMIEWFITTYIEANGLRALSLESASDTHAESEQVRFEVIRGGLKLEIDTSQLDPSKEGLVSEVPRPQITNQGRSLPEK